jgi:hypothetical protein
MEKKHPIDSVYGLFVYDKQAGGKDDSDFDGNWREDLTTSPK